ncbi:MerR family transcriptional regulator [Salinicoccus sp. YB14-2]|uniref:MerR family transcriptional regulator n=1 Tax=Salinicoccus sp. YB14-2 TaxID=1572701 RepID=UPI000690509A|nr:MerR family transcriptional regulator [Salinicoccus sp. YB14-2]
MKTKKVADLIGISVRTLHHYDEIGLISPERTKDNEYRVYTAEDLSKLQQILFFKKLGFKLSNIKKIINDPDYNQEEALLMQKKMLLEERSQLSTMINTIDLTLKEMNGEIEMTDKDKFKGLDFSNNPYEQEARERWGDAAVDNSNRKLKEMDAEEVKRRFDEIYNDLANIRHIDPSSEEAQKEIHKWFVFLNEIGDYSLEAFKSLGDMYVEDERFKKNIDKFGTGLAEFMRQAMTAYYEQNK